MARHHFAPALGQRYERHRPALPIDMCFISEVITPNTLVETERFVLSVDLTTERFTCSRPELAALIMSGYLVPPGETVLSEYRGVSMVDLLQKSTGEQRRRFRMRAAYVLAVEEGAVGLSWKSTDFCAMVNTIYLRRMQSYTAEVRTNPGKYVPPIESHAPSPHSVYRWLLAYRASARDLRSLAMEMLVVRKRKPRRGPERELLDAFLAHRLAFTGKSTITQLTIDFNELASRLDPRHIDREIERLYDKAKIVAKTNEMLRKKKGMSKISKQKPINLR